MELADPKLLKLVREVSEERERRLQAERVARGVQLANAKLRQQIARLTRDSAPAQADHGR